MNSLERKRKSPFEAKDAVEGVGEAEEEGEAMTQEEISAAPTASKRTKAVKMHRDSSNPTTTATTTSTTTKQIPYSPRDPRDALAPYIISPSTHPPSIILKQTPTSVFIRDAFPKALVHVLLLPRDPEKTLLHPFEAFKDEEFLARVRTDAGELKELVARELRRKICGGGKAAGGEGVDWEAEVKVGVHAGPSMNHLHVHVISREGFSDRVKKRVHYNSFNTAFFVPLEELPLRNDDPRWEHHERARLLKMDYTCWRCGRGFGNSFVGIKQHVAEEFVEWKKALIEAGGGGDEKATSS